MRAPKSEMLPKIAQTTAASTRLKPVWNDRSISLSSKLRLMCSLVTSIFLYAFESGTLTAKLQKKMQAMEMRCYRKILRISYKDHVTNEEVRAKIQQAIGPQTTSGNGQAWSSPGPRGQWRTEKMEETSCEIICGASATLVVKG